MLEHHCANTRNVSSQSKDAEWPVTGWVQGRIEEGMAWEKTTGGGKQGWQPCQPHPGMARPGSRQIVSRGPLDPATPNPQAIFCKKMRGNIDDAAALSTAAVKRACRVLRMPETTAV